MLLITILNLLFSKIGCNYKFLGKKDEDEETWMKIKSGNFMPPVEKDNINYFTRLKKTDHLSWYKEEYYMKSRYQVHRLDKMNYEALEFQECAVF